MAAKTSDKQASTTTMFRKTVTSAPRSLVIIRTSGKLSSGGASSSMMTRTAVTRRSDAVDAGFAEGAYASLTSTGVKEVKTTRDQEKKDMQDLNDRFADYINKVRYNKHAMILIMSCLFTRKLYCA